MKKGSFFILILMTGLGLSACQTNPEPPAVSARPHLLGNASAPILIEEFSDPQCPACGTISPQVETIVRENPDLARLEYYQFPLSYHEYAFIASEAAECAGDQNQFFEYLGVLFANQSSLNEDYLYKVADSLKLNREKFDACLSGHDHKADILAQMEEGKKRNIPGTPAIFVNGQLIKWPGPDAFTGYLKSLVQ